MPKCSGRSPVTVALIDSGDSSSRVRGSLEPGPNQGAKGSGPVGAGTCERTLIAATACNSNRRIAHEPRDRSPSPPQREERAGERRLFLLRFMERFPSRNSRIELMNRADVQMGRQLLECGSPLPLFLQTRRTVASSMVRPARNAKAVPTRRDRTPKRGYYFGVTQILR